MRLPVIIACGLLFVGACAGSGKKSVDVLAADPSGECPGCMDMNSPPADLARGEMGAEDISIEKDSPVASEVRKRGACCQIHADCDPGLVCVGVTDEHEGTCETEPDGSICYFDIHCDEFESCQGAQACPCDANCPTIAGTCVALGAGCCEVDEECPTGMRCVGDDETGGGICLLLPDQPEKCWDETDCQQGESCVEAVWCGCAYMLCDPPQMGQCQVDTLAECVETYSGCECYEGCADGFWTVVFYDEALGEFPSDISPTAELLESAWAMYDCSVCACTETWQFNLGGEWTNIDGGAEEFCEILQELDAECGGCLTKWEGGCC